MTTDVHKAFGLLGMEIWDTGGGCTAFGVHLNDDFSSYILVTDDEDAIAPDDTTTLFTVGLYDNAKNFEGIYTDSVDLVTAIKAVARYANDQVDAAAIIEQSQV